MWSISRSHYNGSVSLRRAATLFLAGIITILAWIFVMSPLVSAADGTWQGDSIQYNNRTFDGPKTADGAIPPGLAKDTQYYEANESGKSYIVSFPAGTNVDDATSADYHEYNLTPPSSYTPVGNGSSISLDKKSGTSGGANNNKKETTSCAVGGIGYVLCPILGYIADGMDWVFGLLQGFLEVKPLSTDTNSSLYKSWSYMRMFANIAFVLAFLVITYSYITSTGVSTYDLRKAIPRLIIAAVLINLSYYICAILVDLSNIAGASLQDIMNGIRADLANGQTRNNVSVKWTDITTLILSGGTIAAAGVLHLSGVGGGVLYMLAPILVMAFLAVMLTVVVLAARQAIIIILIILAPIAFSAYVLPSTQKFFDKWKDLFQTMLVMYPLFALMFGGSQLAAYLIAQNATSVWTLLLSLFVGTAPLVMTPFLIKISGGLLGKFAGMINNPNKGMYDRTKNWATDRRDQERAKRLANNSFGSGLARWRDDSKRRDEALKKRYETRRNRNFNASRLGRNLAVQQMLEDDRLAKADNLNKSAYEELKRKDPKVRFEAVQMKIAEMSLEVNKAKMSAYLEELQSEKGGQLHGARDVAIRSLASRMNTLAEEKQIAASRHSIAESIHKKEYSTLLNEDAATDAAGKARALAMQMEAGGIAGAEGALKVKAKAISEIVAANAEAVKNVTTASSVKAGDADGAGEMLQKAIDAQDITSMRAYTDMLAASSDAGIRTLRKILVKNSGIINSSKNFDAGKMEIYKHHINNNESLNRSAEDIGSWSRMPDQKVKLRDVINATDPTLNNWKSLTAESFAGMKRSSQMLALGYTVDADGEMSKTRNGKLHVDERVLEQIWKTDQLLAKIKTEQGKHSVRDDIDEILHGTLHIPRP